MGPGTYMETKNDEMEKKQAIDLLIKSTDMFSEKDYDRLAQQVSGHKYFLGQKLGRDVSWDEAAYSWLDHVYLPISDAMETVTTSAAFHGKERDDVFFHLCDHWFFKSKEAGKQTDVFDTTLDYDANYGTAFGKLLARLQSAGHIA